MKTILILLLLNLSLFAYCPPNTSKYIRVDNAWLGLLSEKDEAIFNANCQEMDRIYRLIEAFVYVESRGNVFAYNKHENAAGVLQIRPVMLNAVNRLSANHYYLKDRYDYNKSVQMWWLIMDKHNPEFDVRKACMIWNGRGKTGKGDYKYYKRIVKRLENYK